MQNGRIPSLDGLRAVAIAMVIVLHINQRFSLANPHTKSGLLLYFLLGLGGDGVGIFFVLSGFLITLLLLREYDSTGSISLSDFYLRRTFRILPPLYAYLAFLIVFSLLVQFPLRVDTITGSALFYRNYFAGNGQWFTEHTWSLCVEEQFYVVWPLAFIWALRRGGRAYASKLAALLIAVTPLFRIATKLAGIHFFEHRTAIMLPGRMDALMSGCLVALLVDSPKFEAVYRAVAKVWWLLPLQFMVLSGIATLIFGGYYHNTVGYTIDSAFIAFFLLWAARNEHSWFGKILNSRPMVTIGVLSYSAYIWQTFFIHEGNPTRMNQMPWALAYIWIAAALSYNFVEQPTLKLRREIDRWRKEALTTTISA